MSILNINLEHIINKVLTEKSKNNNRDYGFFHPSEFYQCHRKLIYKFYESKGICSNSETNSSLIDPRLQRIFDNGHFLHNRLSQNFADTKILKGYWQCSKCSCLYGTEEKLGITRPRICQHCHSNMFVYREVGFHDEATFLGGHVDCILDLRGETINGRLVSLDATEDESHIIVDFKSIRAEAFRKLTSPKDSHFTQMQIYLYLSGLQGGKFLYENKNDQMFREFFVERDDKFIEEQVLAAKSLKKIVTTTNSEGKHALPKRLHKRHDTKECVECSFRSHCWGLKV